MRYVSTRGEAPPLGFMDVTLAGLARDGGLYVPEIWPRLSGETIAGFAGKPFLLIQASRSRCGCARRKSSGDDHEMHKTQESCPGCHGRRGTRRGCPCASR